MKKNDTKLAENGRTSRRNFIRGSAVAAAATTLASVNQAAGQTGGEPIKVGAAVPLTGYAAADGLEIRRGLEMAWEEVNDMGGILGRPVELVLEDTGNFGAENVVTAIQRLIDRHGVHGIVNAYNLGAETAEYDLVADAGICYVHHNTDIIHHSTIQNDPDRYFGIFMGDPAEYWYGAGLLKFFNDLADSGQWAPEERTIAIISGAQNYSVTIANALKASLAEYGWTATIEETLGETISEWGPTLQRLRDNPPAVIAITHWVPQDLAQFMLQFAPNPTNSLIYMQYGPSIPAFREIGGSAVNGVIYSTVIATLPDEIGGDFSRRYKARYGENAVALTAGMTYDSVHYFANAAAIAGGLGAPGDFEQNRRVAKQLSRTIYRGVNGTTRFDPDVHAAVSYPTSTNDPSLGMPHQYLQISDHTQPPRLIAPAPYNTASFQMPSWIRT
ncbi:ABC transporter substrate-binding protein [Pacificibacter marinus]|uniref:ABC transporter substrate-binding protein n=1 Tax=Pacificibacter marinus TaxID=658057 RepID=UPI001C06634B|nr:ABC transporter substrate-binding protein [Pacificibacter marinus]MBU2867430.1 ABC transporter substrate-binding protein [Pacificibacter marinus]